MSWYSLIFANPSVFLEGKKKTNHKTSTDCWRLQAVIFVLFCCPVKTVVKELKSKWWTWVKVSVSQVIDALHSGGHLHVSFLSGGEHTDLCADF